MASAEAPRPAPKAAPRMPTPKAQECPFVQGDCAELPLGKVNYVLHGPPGAPLVVCLHGLNGSTASFASIEPLLLAAGLRVLLFDWYGFGLSSSTPRHRLNQETYVEQLESLLDAVGVRPDERLLLLGYSMGGIVAVEFALRNPGRVQRVLLVAPGGLLEKEETPCHPFVFGCLRTRCGCCVLQVVACLAFCCHAPLGAFSQSGRFEGQFNLDVREPERFADLRELNSRRFAWDIRRSVTSYLRVIKSMPLWSDDFKSSYERLARSNVPVLFIWGDDDCTIPWSEVGEEVVSLFRHRNASCIRLPGAGHGLLVEDAEEVAQYAVAWFKDSKDPAWLGLLQRFLLSAPDALEPLEEEGQAPASAPEPEVLGNKV